MINTELCEICFEVTGRVGKGDDSIYIELIGDLFAYKNGDEIGPLCENCLQSMYQLGLVEEI